jgi:hypothetical protein
MTTRGRAAALPATPHRRRPARDESATIVVHIGENGDRQAVYDFTRMLVSPDMQRSLAALFADRLSPVGPWRQIASSEEVFGLLMSFTGFLATFDEPPSDIAAITPAIWHAWVLSRSANALGDKQIRRVAAFLRLDPQLPAGTRGAGLKPVPARATTEKAYSTAEFEQITQCAALSFRAAWQRISDNRRHLTAWRAGEYVTGTDDYRLGEILDHLARTGDVRIRIKGNGQRAVPSAVARLLGGTTAAFTWRRLYLSNIEIVSLAVLLVAKHGWNSTTVAELPTPDLIAEDGQQVVYRIELEKRRRKPPHRYETRNLTDWGPNSPGRLITRAIDATTPARDLLATRGEPADRLLVSRLSRLRAGQASLQLGFGDNDIKTWAIGTGVPVNLRRLRRTAVVKHQRVPTQHSRDTHDQIYVLRDPATHEEAEPIIAAGVAEAVRHAQDAVRARVDRNDNAGDRANDTVTANCGDYRHSPFSPHGSGCRASFLLCLACPNAVVTPRHVPRLAYLHVVLEQLRGVVDAAIWDHDWREHYARLTDLRDAAFTPTEWADALTALSTADRAVIDDLLRRGFDV